MDFKDNFPIYVQIMNFIKRRIALGELKEGDKLESVRELSAELKVNPNTIQRAYQELEREGFAYTKRGMGTFVTEKTEDIRGLKKKMALEIADNFVEEMRSIGFEFEETVEFVRSLEEEKQ